MQKRNVTFIGQNEKKMRRFMSLLPKKQYSCTFSHLSDLHSIKPGVLFFYLSKKDQKNARMIEIIDLCSSESVCIACLEDCAHENIEKFLKIGVYDVICGKIHTDEFLMRFERWNMIAHYFENHRRKSKAIHTLSSELDNMNERIHAIIDSTRRIATCTNIPEFGKQCLNELSENIGVSGGSFYLKRGSMFDQIASLDEGHAAITVELPFQHGSLLQKVYAEKKPLLIEDVARLEDARKSGWSGYTDDSCILLPILGQFNDVVGIISLHNKEVPPMTMHDLDFGTLIATYAYDSFYVVRITENLIHNEEKYRRLVETMNDGLVILDHEGCVVYANQRFCNITGYCVSEMLNTKLSDYMDEHTKIDVCSCAQECTGNSVIAHEIIWHCKNGEQKTTLVAPQVVSRTGSSNDVRRCFMVVTDITERKNSEEALKKQKREADIRVKELNCLLAISSIVDRPHASLDDILQNTVSIIPNAFQYPKYCCARITVDGKEYVTTSCQGDVCKLIVAEKRENVFFREIISSGVVRGSICVWYRKDLPTADEGPFLKEERGIINAVAELLGSIFEKHRSSTELTQSLNTLKQTMEGIIQAMAMTSEIRDPYTAGHQRRVSKLACAIAEKMNLTEDMINGIRLAALIHDLGKIYVPAEILSKPGIISDIEFNIIKTHAQVGHDILQTIDFPWPLADIIHQHHERLDGSGYPYGLKKKDILLEARIIAVADTVEAMAFHRPYRPSLGIESALEEINTNAGKLYDSEIVDVCTELFLKKGFEF